MTQAPPCPAAGQLWTRPPFPGQDGPPRRVLVFHPGPYAGVARGASYPLTRETMPR